MKTKLFAALVFFGWSVLAGAAPVDINSADAQVLAAGLRGVGVDRAQAIVQYRKTNGPFRSVDELVKVKGIGKKIVEANRVNLIVSSSSPAK